MPNQVSRTEAIEKIAELIKDCRIAMLTTVTPEGWLHARPMATMDVEFDGDLWFFTAKSSPKVQEIEADSRVNVAYSNPGEQDYVSVAGNAKLVIDRALNEKYWNPMFEAWFPEGLDDPELALLHVEADSAEYWDSPSSTIAHLRGLIRTKLGGDIEAGENEKVSL